MGDRFCFMFSHRDAPITVSEDIKQAVLYLHTSKGINDFVVGSRAVSTEYPLQQSPL